MQIPISQVRAKLPQLVKQLKHNPSLTYEITVHHEVVAELKAPAQLPQGGEAAKSLLAIIAQLPKSKSRRKGKISENVKAHLYPNPHESKR